MRAKPLPRMTADEFIEWAMGLPDGERYELVGGELVAMSPERAVHTRTKGRACRGARAMRCAALACRARCSPDGMSVQVDADTVYEPDALVRCGEPVHEDAVKIADPVIIVEVVSPSSAARTRGPSLRTISACLRCCHYLVVDVRKRSVVHHHRDAAGQIQTRIVRAGTLELSPPGIALALDDLFP